MQQMQLEVKMQAGAVLGGYSMTIGRVWGGLLRLIHLHVHSAITPHIPCHADRNTQLPNALADSEPRPVTIVFSFRKESHAGILFNH